MKRSIALLLAGVLSVGAMVACGGDTPAVMSTFSVGPQQTPTPTEESPSPTGPGGAVEEVGDAVAGPVGPPSVLPPPAPPPAPLAGRNVPLGEVFRLRAGETAGITGEDLVVTYVQLLSDNRCLPGVRCIVGGNAKITVTVGSDSSPPATFTLNTDEDPRSGRYLDRTVELVDLSRGNRPAASLRVS